MASYTVFGFYGCSSCERALRLLEEKHCVVSTMLVPHIGWRDALTTVKSRVGGQAVRAHTTSPLIFANGRYVGGYAQLAALISP